MLHPVRIGLPLFILLCAGMIAVPFAQADSPYIYSMHDPGGEHLMGGNKGWIVWTEAIGTSGSGGNNYTAWSNQGYGVIVRLNNGYGSSGTLPYESQYGAFASRCANYIQNSSGVDYWIIGNECNLPREWPGNVNGDSNTGEPITATRYISCYNQCYTAIKDVVPSAKLCPAPSGTWAPPYPAQGIEGFVDYWLNYLNGIGASKIDGLILHTYTHGCDPALVTSEVKMGPPYEAIYYHFRAYKNYMWVIPAGMQNKPVLITECDQNTECADGASPRHTWYNVNNGWMKAAYGEIHNWNQSNTQQIRCLTMFRWPMTAEGEWTFGLADRDQCQIDFSEAAAFGYQWGTGTGMTSDVPTGTNLSLSYTQVSVSSQFDANSGGEKALDGVVAINSKWTSDGSAMPEWLIVDLGNTQTVNGYIVRHAEAAGENDYLNTEAFAIQSGTSMSGPWTDETVVANAAQDPVTYRSYTTPKSLRYIRLYVTDAGIDTYVRIPEFEIIGVGSTPTPIIARSPTSLSPSTNVGSSPPNDTFTVWNSGTGTLNYAISDNVSWLSVSPASGTSTGETDTDTLTVTYSTSGRSVGTHNATIAVSDPAASNNPQTIAVTLTVVDPAGNLLVNGDFESGMTGWASWASTWSSGETETVVWDAGLASNVMHLGVNSNPGASFGVYHQVTGLTPGHRYRIDGRWKGNEYANDQWYEVMLIDGAWSTGATGTENLDEVDSGCVCVWNFMYSYDGAKDCGGGNSWPGCPMTSTFNWTWFSNQNDSCPDNGWHDRDGVRTASGATLTIVLKAGTYKGGESSQADVWFDDITLVDLDAVTYQKPVLTGALSRKTHGTAGDWNVNVGNGVIECRSAQVGTANPNELLIVATFDVDIDLLGSGGDVVSTDVGTVVSADQTGTKELTIAIANLPFNTQVNLTFPGVVEENSLDPASASNSTLCMRIIVGDYDWLGRTNFADFANVKNAGYLNDPVSDYFKARADFDCNGRVNFLDFAKVNNAGLIDQTANACAIPIGP